MKLHIAIIALVLLASCAPTPLTDRQEIPDVAGDDQAVPDVPDDSLAIPRDTDSFDSQFYTRCDEPTSARLMLDAFPPSYKGFVQVGQEIADRSEIPTGEGMTLQTNTLRTLSRDDLTYIDYSSYDACGFNTNKQSYDLLEVVGENEYGWTKMATVNGYEGKLTYDTGMESYRFQVLLKNRVLVIVDSFNTDEATVLDAASEVDYAAIEAAIE